MTINTHVVVTHYRRPGGQVVVHAYGPWSKVKATNQRRKILAESKQEVFDGRLSVSVCKMLDIES